MKILVLNSGSSSIKYQLLEIPGEILIAYGQLECIGEPESKLIHNWKKSDGLLETEIQQIHIPEYSSAVGKIIELLGRDNEISAIGHRVVHGGGAFSSPIRINQQVIDSLHDMSELAPMHNYANLKGIEVCQDLFENIPQVAVFDTAFHQTMPAYAYRYALPRAVYENYAVRRYGFHGTSHAYVVQQVASYLDFPLSSLNMISLHIGNGVSAAAVQGGQCIDTSMGFTPLEGLMMGSRCGDIDPAITFFLQRKTGKSTEAIEALLNNESGLKGICGENDMRKVLHLADAGNADAQLAVEMYCYRIRKYIGAYYAALGRVDALIFTAGIGENSARIRQLSCSNLETLGIRLDENKNADINGDVCEIQALNSNIKVFVVRTNEALEIARQTFECINSQ